MGLMNEIIVHQILGMVSDSLVARHHNEKPHSVVISKREEWIKEDKTLSQTEYALYRDGSKTEKGLGADVFGPKPNCHCNVINNVLVVFPDY